MIYNFSLAQIVILNNQIDVDNFATNYPGDNTFTSIRINASYISNLNGLSQVTEITGDLHIASLENNYLLTDISGLYNLTNVGGRIYLSDLKFIDATNLFPNLIQVGSSVSGNALTIDGLTPSAINGFNSLINITGDLVIVDTTTLITLSGFNSLIKVNISNNDIGSVFIINNSALTTINGFGNLQEIGWNYDILGNPNLTSLPNTPNLTIIGNSIRVQYCNSLTNLIGISSVTSPVNGGLEIVRNNNLINLNGLNGLTICNGINISNNSLLSDLSALSSLATFHAMPILNRPSINVYDNTSLSSLTGLDNIDGSTIGNVTIKNNPNLSLCAIESFCEKIAFDSNLSGFTQVNNNLTNCNSAGEINAVCQILSINENPKRNTFTAYPNPVKTLLYLSNYENINVVILSDVLGKLRIKKVAENNTVDVTDLEKGVYFIQATLNNRMETVKFIKE